MKKVAMVLVIIGALNWGLVGLGMLFNQDWNVVNMLLGSMPIVEAIVYLLVGLSVIKFFWCSCAGCKGMCNTCGCHSGGAPKQM